MKYFRNAYDFADKLESEKYNVYIECVNRLSDSLILENGEYIKNCNFLLSQELYESCYHDKDIIREHCLLEGAKLDLTLKNFLKEGQDYKDLKKNIKELVKAYDLNDEDLISGKRKLLHICKRILQVLSDIESVLIVGGSSAGAVAILFSMTAEDVAMAGGIGATIFEMGAGLIFVAIITFIYYFLERLFRVLVDYVEFDTIRKDANNIIDQLEDNAKKSKDKKLKKEYKEKAEELKNKLRKYENKSVF